MAGGVFCCLFLVLVSVAIHRGTEGTKNSYDEALAASYLKRAYRLARSQAGSSSSAQSSRGAASSSGGGTAGSSSIDISGASRGSTAGPAETGPSTFGCDKCDQKFESEFDLYDHKRSYHTVPSDAHCYLCNYTFSNRKNFKIHLRRKHPEIAAVEAEREYIQASEENSDRPHACPVCRKRYRTTHSLRDHYKSHTTDDTTCHLCNQVYSTRAIFKRHVLDQHPGVEVPEPTDPFGECLSDKEIEGGPYVCNKCGKSYVYKRDLKVHMKIHETSETYFGYSNLTLPSRQSYNTHMEERHREDARIEKAVESEEKKTVKCDRCDRCFKNTDSLRHHKKVHEGKTNCEICGAKFNSRSAYYSHKKNEHPPKK